MARSDQQLTHQVHYAGITMKVTYAQAYYVTQALIAAKDGGCTLLVLEAVSLGFDEVITNYLLVAPGVPVLVQGPPITEIADAAI